MSPEGPPPKRFDTSSAQCAGGGHSPHGAPPPGVVAMSPEGPSPPNYHALPPVAHRTPAGPPPAPRSRQNGGAPTTLEPQCARGGRYDMTCPPLPALRCPPRAPSSEEVCLAAALPRAQSLNGEADRGEEDRGAEVGIAAAPGQQPTQLPAASVRLLAAHPRPARPPLPPCTHFLIDLSVPMPPDASAQVIQTWNGPPAGGAAASAPGQQPGGGGPMPAATCPTQRAGGGHSPHGAPPPGVVATSPEGPSPQRVEWSRTSREAVVV